MRLWIVAAITTLLGCRGEPVPRDYQNAPPAMTHPADTKTDAPATGGMGQAAPEPSAGNEGPNAQPVQMTPAAEPVTTTISDTPATTTT